MILQSEHIKMYWKCSLLLSDRSHRMIDDFYSQCWISIDSYDFSRGIQLTWHAGVLALTELLLDKLHIGVNEKFDYIACHLIATSINCSWKLGNSILMQYCEFWLTVFIIVNTMVLINRQISVLSNKTAIGHIRLNWILNLELEANLF